MSRPSKEEVKRAMVKAILLRPKYSRWEFELVDPEGGIFGRVVLDLGLGGVVQREGCFEVGREFGDIPDDILLSACRELFQ